MTGAGSLSPGTPPVTEIPSALSLYRGPDSLTRDGRVDNIEAQTRRAQRAGPRSLSAAIG